MCTLLCETSCPGAYGGSAMSDCEHTDRILSIIHRERPGWLNNYWLLQERRDLAWRRFTPFPNYKNYLQQIFSSRESPCFRRRMARPVGRNCLLFYSATHILHYHHKHQKF